MDRVTFEDEHVTRSEADASEPRPLGRRSALTIGHPQTGTFLQGHDHTKGFVKEAAAGGRVIVGVGLLACTPCGTVKDDGVAEVPTSVEVACFEKCRRERGDDGAVGVERTLGSLRVGVEDLGGGGGDQVPGVRKPRGVDDDSAAETLPARSRHRLR